MATILPSQSAALAVQQHDSTELSPSTRQRLLQDNLRLLQHANIKHWQAIFETAGAIWNIATHKLHVAEEEKGFEELMNSLGFKPRSVRRYKKIGQAMFEHACQLAGMENVNPLTFTFTQKGIAQAYEGYFTNGHAVTVHGLEERSKNLDQFLDYLRNPNEDKGKAPLHLLEAHNVVSEKHLESKDRKATLKSNVLQEMHERMEHEADALDLKWDRKKRTFVNKDGSPLADDQLVEFETPATAVAVWKSFDRDVLSLQKKISESVKQHGQSFVLYAQIPHTKFRNEIDDRVRDLHKKIDVLKHMADALLGLDLNEVHNLAKLGLDD
jgi:hypothetical protein